MDFELEMNLCFNKRGNCYRSDGGKLREEEESSVSYSVRLLTSPLPNNNLNVPAS